MLDLYTGSGAIPLLMGHVLGAGHTFVAVDIQPSAVALAEENAQSLHQNLLVIQDDVCRPGFGENLGSFDVITANPPYISAEEYAKLDPSLRYEDRRALVDDDDEDGLGHYRLLAKRFAAAQLQPKTVLATEIGSGQGRAVADLFQFHGLGHIEVWKDQWDHDRLVVVWFNSP